MALEKGRWPSGGGSSLEWIHRGKFLSISEFTAKKHTGLKEHTLTIDTDGNRQAVNDFGNISPVRSSVKLGKTPYFPNASKISEIIYFPEGVCRKVLPISAQCSIQSRIRRSSGSNKQPTSFDLSGTRVCWPILLGGCVWNCLSRENRYSKSDGPSLFDSHRGDQTLTKNMSPLPPFTLSIWEWTAGQSPKTERKTLV